MPFVAKKPHKKTPTSKDEGVSKKGGDILSHRIAVPSAQAGLTSLFGMGRGEPRRNNHLKSLCCFGQQDYRYIVTVNKYLNILR